MDFLRKKNPKVSLHQNRVFSTVKEKFEYGGLIFGGLLDGPLRPGFAGRPAKAGMKLAHRIHDAGSGLWNPSLVQAIFQDSEMGECRHAGKDGSREK